MTLPSWFASMSDSLGFLFTFGVVTFAVAVGALVLGVVLMCGVAMIGKLNGTRREEEREEIGHYLEDA